MLSFFDVNSAYVYRDALVHLVMRRTFSLVILYSLSRYYLDITQLLYNLQGQFDALSNLRSQGKSIRHIKYITRVSALYNAILLSISVSSESWEC